MPQKEKQEKINYPMDFLEDDRKASNKTAKAISIEDSEGHEQQIDGLNMELWSLNISAKLFRGLIH